MSQRKATSAETKNREKNTQRKASVFAPEGRKESLGGGKKQTGGKGQKSGAGQKPPVKKFRLRSNLLRSLISNLDSTRARGTLVAGQTLEERDEGEKGEGGRQMAVPMHGRKIRSEDPSFNAPRVPSLLDLCIEAAVLHFPKHIQILERTPVEFRNKIIDRLPTDLPISVTTGTVEHEGYWKKKCKERWRDCDLADHGHSWKRAYLERNLEEELENFIPDVSSLEDLRRTASTSSEHVKRLELLQMLPKGLPPNWGTPQSEDPWCRPSKSIQVNSSVDVDEDADLDHLDLSTLLPDLHHLRELHLRYSVSNCGTRFRWNYFRISDQDCQNLARCIHLCPKLERLSLTRSRLNDSGVNILCSQLKNHTNLTTLNLSHNVLSDLGAEAMSSALLERRQNGVCLKELDLTNNKIGACGGQALARGLTGNHTLVRLELRLNGLKDNGGSEVLGSLERNRSLRYLGLAGNFLGDLTTEALCRILTTNQSLEVIDLSCNNLGEANGELIYSAMKSCHSIKHMDLSETGMGKELEYLIGEICDGNSGTGGSED